MSGDNLRPSRAAVFSAVLTPHRSLGPGGVRTVIILFALVCLAPGLMFFLMGAWPVAGFLGLDVLLLAWAFRSSARSAAAYEQVTVTPGELTVRQVSHRRSVREWTVNPLWVRLAQERDEEYGLRRLFVVCRGNRLPIANCLAPSERESFAQALSQALREVRHGPSPATLKPR